MTDDHECQFPEEQTPEGVRILYPCLLCGMAALDAMQQLKQEAEQIYADLNNLRFEHD